MTGRLAITGATGLLGRALVEAAALRGVDTVALARRDAHDLPFRRPVQRCALTDAGAALRPWASGPLDVLIHAAAMTNVDACEDDPAAARALHVDASEAVAEACTLHGTHLVHISTDSVFDGRRSLYDEDDAPDPANVYARTKFEGERAVLRACPTALVVRTNFFGARPSLAGQSLAEWGLKELLAGRPVTGFEDVWFNPLWTGHLAGLLLDVAALRTSGVLHLAASEGLNKGDFLRRLASAFGLDAALVRSGRLADRPWRAARPLCTVLDTRRATAVMGRPLPSIDAGIEAFRLWAHSNGIRPR